MGHIVAQVSGKSYDEYLREQRANQVVQRHRRLGLATGVLVEILACEFLGQISRQVRVDIFGAQQVVRVLAERLAVRVVDRCLQGTGCDKLSQPWQRFGQRQLAFDIGRELAVRRRQLVGYLAKDILPGA